jgi:hypothetical protein
MEHTVTVIAARAGCHCHGAPSQWALIMIIGPKRIGLPVIPSPNIMEVLARGPSQGMAGPSAGVTVSHGASEWPPVPHRHAGPTRTQPRRPAARHTPHILRVEPPWRTNFVSILFLVTFLARGPGALVA